MSALTTLEELSVAEAVDTTWHAIADRLSPEQLAERLAALRADPYRHKPAEFVKVKGLIAAHRLRGRPWVEVAPVCVGDDCCDGCRDAAYCRKAIRAQRALADRMEALTGLEE